MSICRTVEDSKLLQKAAVVNRRDLVQVEVYPSAEDLIPYPSDYQIPSCLLPSKFTKLANQYENFKVRSDDIWVVTFPKSGTTWTMNIVWQLINGLDLSANNLPVDYNYFEKLMSVDETRSKSERVKNIVEQLEKNWNELGDLPSPRLIKSHLPAQLLPTDVWIEKPRIIYVCRDARDAAISLYHFYRNHAQVQFSKKIEDFLDMFMNDQIGYGPYHSHVNSYCQLNKLDNILLINYEEMKSNPFDEVKRINDFLQYEYTDDQLKQLTEHMSFENMHKKNNIDLIKYPNGFNFFRKGEVGGYRDEMSLEYIQKFDEWKNNNRHF